MARCCRLRCRHRLPSPTVVLAAVTLLVAPAAGAREHGTATTQVGPYFRQTTLPTPRDTTAWSSAAISASGETAVVGAPGAQAAWIFVHRGGNTWAATARLSGGPGFGSSVAVSGDGKVALVGAPLDGAERGSASLFVKHGPNVWVGQKLRVGGLDSKADFGSDVALSADGSIALVGASRQNGFKGAVFAFARGGGTWKQQARLAPTGGQGMSKLGTSVALSADGRIGLAGAPDDRNAAGAVWALTRSGSTWKGSRFGPEYGGQDHFGAAVALTADAQTALIGAPTSAHSSSRNAQKTGFVELYARSGSTWRRTGSLAEPLVPDGRRHPDFGRAVAVAGDGKTAVVAGSGGIFGYARSSSLSSSWQDEQTLGSGSDVALSHDGRFVLAGGSVWVIPPMVTSVTPSEGPTSGGTEVVVAGTGFERVLGVSFDETPATSFAVESSTRIRAVSPAGPARYAHVLVKTAVGVSPSISTGFLARDGFSFRDRPTVTAIEPATGPTTGGTTVRITGTNLTPATRVEFGSSAAIVTGSGSQGSITTLTVTSPPGQVGTVHVTVTTAGGTSATSAADRFTYTSPVIEKVVTFDDLVTGGPNTSAGGLVKVGSQYASQGVTFNDVSAIDYSKGQSAIDGFAASGAVGIEQCVGVEFCTTPIRATFAAPHRLVRVYVGFSFRLDSQVRVELRALDAGGATVGTATATLGPSAQPVPIRTPLEVSAGSAVITELQVSMPGGYGNALAVDSVTFAD